MRRLKDITSLIVRTGFIRLAVSVVTILQIFLLNQIAVSQTSLEKIKFTKIDAHKGLSNSNITCVYQDSKQFLWVGTTDGLNKYDGYNFTVYRKTPLDFTGFLNNSICEIYEDSRGKLWVSTHNGGFYYYDRSLDRFFIVPELSDQGEIVRILEDKNGTLWVGGILDQKAFIADYNPQSNTWRRYYNPLFPSKDVVTGIIQESENEYWLTIKKSGLFKWNKKTNELSKIQEEGLNNYVGAFTQDATGKLWFATRSGLIKFDPKNKIFKHFLVNSLHPERSIPVNVIHTLCLEDQYLWLGTENGGLSRMNINTETFTHFTFDKNNPNSVCDNSIWSIYKDHQNRVWVGTYSKGLCVYDKMKDKFQELNVPLSNDIVNAIWIDQKGRLWVGTEGGLTMSEGGNIQYYAHEQDDKNSIPNNPILTILEDSKNRLWFGSWDGGVSLYNENQNNFTNYVPDSNKPNSLSNPHVFSIKEESATHHILVGTHHGLNVLADEAQGRFETHLDNEENANNYINRLYEDKSGALWIGSIVALNRYDLKSGDYTKYLFNEKTKSRTFISCITEDDEGNLWIGTDKGLYRMKDKVVVENYTMLDGLPTDNITGILIDHSNNLWISSTAGISMFNRKTKTFKNYDVNDGLVSNEFKANACFKSKDGRFFFGSSSGINVFNPDSIKTNSYPPNVFLTGLKIFNKVISIGAADSVLHEHISETREITLNTESNFFTIEYVGINFTNSHKNQFAYKLDGFDRDWVNAGTQRFATFTNLDPGKYVFRVKASNNDGLWNEQEARLVIIILPCWYESLLFKVSMVFLAVLLFIGFFVYRTHSITSRNLFLEKVVRERTEKLASVNDELIQLNSTLIETNQSLGLQRKLALDAICAREQFLSIMSHEIRTPLNSMIGLTYVLTKRSPRSDQKEIIDTLKNSSDHLMNLVNDILDYNKIKANMVELEHSRFNLNEVLHQIHAMFYRMANDKNISFIVQVGSTMPDKLKGDPTRLIQILSNLVSNSIKYTSTGSITLNIFPSKIEDDTVITKFHIKDTGIGIHADKLSLIFEPFIQVKDTHRNSGGTGLGLTIVKNLTELMNGEVKVESRPGIGTSFIITIPFKIQEQDDGSSDLLIHHDIELKNIKVLNVEDVESNQFLINNLFADYGIGCETASNGQEAISAIQKEKYDIILLDIQMPDMNGFDVANIIRKSPTSMNHYTPIIIFSASTNIREDSIMECQANDFIGKPFKPDELIKKMQKVLKFNKLGIS